MALTALAFPRNENSLAIPGVRELFRCESHYEHYIGKNTFHLIGLSSGSHRPAPEAVARAARKACQRFPGDTARGCLRPKHVCQSAVYRHRDTMSFIVDGSQDAIWQLVINARTANSILGPIPVPARRAASAQSWECLSTSRPTSAGPSHRRPSAGNTSCCHQRSRPKY